jgi:dTDP-4-amino-4,6-dideoxygalactose transaminase
MHSTDDLGPELTIINEAFVGVLRHRQYVLGPEVEKLEEVMANWLNTRHAIGCNSGFGAFLLSLLSLNTGVNSRVAISAFAPPSFVGAILRQGATPVLVDIIPGDFHISPVDLANKMDGTIETIVVHHLFGGIANLPAIMELVSNANLIEVITYSLGARIGNKHVGTYGTLATSCLREETTPGAYGDAGMIWTNSTQLSQRIRRIRAETNRTGVHEGFASGNFHQDTIHAAILLRRLDAWLEIVEERCKLAASFARALMEVGPKQILVPETYKHYATFFVVLAEQRDAILDYLQEKGVAASAWWPTPIYSQPGFHQLGYQRGDFPEAERIAELNLCLPLPKTELEAAQLIDHLVSFYD